MKKDPKYYSDNSIIFIILLYFIYILYYPFEELSSTRVVPLSCSFLDPRDWVVY
jgi:hypothetical protein